MSDLSYKTLSDPTKKLNFPIFNVNMPKYTCLRGSAAVHMLSNSDISEFYLREGVSLFQKSLNYSVWGGAQCALTLRQNGSGFIRCRTMAMNGALAL